MRPLRPRRSARRRRVTGDDGSVLPLVVGAVVVVVTLVTVVTDVGALWLQRRSLQATVDGAALAGAQSLDLASFYADGAQGDLRLDARTARIRVRAYTASLPSARRLTSFRLTAVTVDTTTVTVRANAVARLPFLSWVTGRGVTLVAQASARSATR